ncbi:sensor histidine kinase [bacterium]|nr:sensor histidine kinase [bacterium]
MALNIETANPCGLIVNELLSNCLKHAFPDGRSGNIWVSLCQDDDRNITLVIRDDGIGFPKDLDLRQVDSLGLELVRSLTKQIQGILEMERCNGTLFRLTFSELYYRQRC